ncbi:MAG: hypothetical protein AAB521_01315 [Patescibacteria group bacterium]
MENTIEGNNAQQGSSLQPKEQKETPKFFGINQSGAIIIAIAVISILIIVGAAGYYLLSKNKVITSTQENNTSTQFSPQTSQKTPKQTAINDSIPILKDYNSKSFGRNLWLYDKDLIQGVQITSEHDILGLYGKSPDDKKVLVSTVNRVPNDNNVHEKISIVDIDTRNITRLFPSYNETSSVTGVYWLDNNRIIYALGRQIKIYTISSGSEEVLVDAEKSITDATRIIFNISPDKKWLAYYYSGNGEGDPPQQDKNTYSINLENKKQTRLFSLSDGYYNALNNNFVIYSKAVDSKVQIWRIDFLGSNGELITTLPKGELINITSNDSGNKFIYQVRSYSLNSGSAELYLYNLDTKMSQMFFKTEVADGIRDPRISPDGDSVLFSAGLDKNVPLKFTIVKFDLQTNRQTTLNNDQEPSSSTVIIF